MFTFLLFLLSLASIAFVKGGGDDQKDKGLDDCASHWGFWLTSEEVFFGDAYKACSSLGLKLMPLHMSDKDPMNPVFRYMAGRVAERCNILRFWVDSGLFITRTVLSKIRGDETPKYRALCYLPTVEYPENAPPGQSVMFTTTVTKTGTATRPFDLDIILTETVIPEPSVTIYTSIEVTTTIYVTQTFSTPTSVKYRKLAWHTVTERETNVQTESLGISTTTHTRTLTVTTSVIAVVQQVLTVTSYTRCPDKVSGFVRVTIPTEPIVIPNEPEDQPIISMVKKILICDRFSSLAEIKQCNSYEHHDSSLVLITTPVSFIEAGCACEALGLTLADMTNENSRREARKIIKSCLDIPGQKVWIRGLNKKEVEVCMAIGTNADGDGPVACIQEQPVFCQ